VRWQHRPSAISRILLTFNATIRMRLAVTKPARAFNASPWRSPLAPRAPGAGLHPTRCQFRPVGVDGRLFLMYFPANRKALCFPPAYGALVPFQISGNFLSRNRGARQKLRWGEFVAEVCWCHERTLRGAEYLGIVAHGTAKSNSQLEGPRSG